MAVFFIMSITVTDINYKVSCILMAIILSVFIYLFILKKYHFFYFIFPIMYLSGMILVGINSNHSILYESLDEETGMDVTLSGSVYKTQETDYGNRFFLKNVRCNDEKVENCIVNTEYNYDLGDLIYVQGIAKTFDTARNPGEFDLKKYYRTINVYFKVTAKESYVIKKNSFIIYDYAQKCSDIMKKILYSITDEVNASVFCAMLLGNKDEMDKDISDIFSACGIGHILAISGVKIQNLAIPLTAETRINRAFVPLHIAKIYILKLCFNEEIIPRCRFPCSRG